MIHRNGKNKEGEEIELNQKVVKDVIYNEEVKRYQQTDHFDATLLCC